MSVMGIVGGVGVGYLKSKAIDAVCYTAAAAVATVPGVGPVAATGIIGARNAYKVGKVINTCSRLTQPGFDKGIDSLVDQGFSPEDAAMILGSV